MVRERREVRLWDRRRHRPGHILPTTPSVPTPSQSTNTNANVKISEATAKQIALSSVPGATAANIYKFKLDFDDGRWEYEGEIRYGTMEYDFTIDANTGAIIEWDMESIYD